MNLRTPTRPSDRLRAAPKAVPRARRVSRRPQRTARPLLERVPVHVFLAIVALVWVTPILGLLVSSLRPAASVALTGWWQGLLTPGDLTLANYDRALNQNGLAASVLNSFAITVPATVGTVALASAAAYALSRHAFRLQMPILVTLVMLTAVPIQVTLVPLLRLMSDAHLTGTFTGIWFLHIGYGLPFAVYLLANSFMSLPDEVFEAAALDGANSVQTFFRIVIPVSRPIIASVAIFTFVWTWNDLLVSLIFLGGDREVAPLTVAVSNMVASRGEGWQVLTSAAIVSIAVPVAVFLSAQRHFVSGILAGSTKG